MVVLLLIVLAFLDDEVFGHFEHTFQIVATLLDILELPDVFFGHDVLAHFFQPEQRLF
jgi:hypothetical protein